MTEVVANNKQQEKDFSETENSGDLACDKSPSVDSPSGANPEKEEKNTDGNNAGGAAGDGDSADKKEGDAVAADAEIPEGCVPYSGDVEQLKNRVHTDPQIIVPTNLWPAQPLNQGICIPYFLGDPTELAKIQPPKVVMTIEERKKDLSEEELAAMEDLRAHCKEKGYKLGPGLHKDGFIDDWTLIRYLIARQWKVKKSAAMLDATMKWRADQTYETLVCTKCRMEKNAHCMSFMGWDKQHRPVMYMSHRWALHRGVLKDDVAHVTESYDHMTTMMSEGVTQWVALVDFVTYSHWKDGSPSTGKAVGAILQDHFPERLALQVLVDPPTSFWLLWKVLGAFMDPKTKSKVEFWYTDDEPHIENEFPKLFPEHLSEWLLTTYLNNKKKDKKKKDK